MRPPGRTLQKSTRDKQGREFPNGTSCFFFGCNLSLLRTLQAFLSKAAPVLRVRKGGYDCNHTAVPP